MTWLWKLFWICLSLIVCGTESLALETWAVENVMKKNKQTIHFEPKGLSPGFASSELCDLCVLVSVSMKDRKWSWTDWSLTSFAAEMAYDVIYIVSSSEGCWCMQSLVTYNKPFSSVGSRGEVSGGGRVFLGSYETNCNKYMQYCNYFTLVKYLLNSYHVENVVLGCVGDTKFMSSLLLVFLSALGTMRKFRY